MIEIVVNALVRLSVVSGVVGLSAVLFPNLISNIRRSDELGKSEEPEEKEESKQKMKTIGKENKPTIEIEGNEIIVTDGTIDSDFSDEIRVAIKNNKENLTSFTLTNCSFDYQCDMKFIVQELLKCNKLESTTFENNTLSSNGKDIVENYVEEEIQLLNKHIEELKSERAAQAPKGKEKAEPKGKEKASVEGIEVKNNSMFVTFKRIGKEEKDQILEAIERQPLKNVKKTYTKNKQLKTKEYHHCLIWHSRNMRIC